MVTHKRKTLEDHPINRQTALYTLKLLCKNFGAENPEPFVPVLTTTVRLIALGAKEEKNVLGSALLCVAEVVSTLEALAIPQLPRYAEGTWGRTTAQGFCYQLGNETLVTFFFFCPSVEVSFNSIC